MGAVKPRKTFDSHPLSSPTTVMGVSCSTASDKIEARNPDKRSFHVIGTRRPYRQRPRLSGAFSARADLAVSILISCRPYFALISNPIERALGRLCINTLPTIATTPSSKAVRRRHPCIHCVKPSRRNGRSSSDKSQDNFAFIKTPPKTFRVLKIEAGYKQE